MGSSSSRHHKATSPYSSWGQSFDDLLCGPGKICADEWTPLPSRSHSLSPSHRRHHSIALSPGGAEVYTVRRKSFNGVIDQQPLPIGSSELRSPYHLASARSRRRKSYQPNERVVATRPVTPFRPKMIKKKKKKRPSLHRVDTYPLDEPTIIKTPAIVPVHRRRSRSRKKPSSLDNRPPWRDILTPRRYQEYLHGEPSNPLPDVVRGRSLSPNIPPLKIHTKGVSRQVEQLSAKTYTGSGSGSTGKKFVAPRDKIGEEPPPAFRVRGIPDVPYQRIPTMATLIRK